MVADVVLAIVADALAALGASAVSQIVRLVRFETSERFARGEPPTCTLDHSYPITCRSHALDLHLQIRARIIVYRHRNRETWPSTRLF